MTTIVPLFLGPLLSPPGVLGILILVAIVILVGRIVLKVAWRLVVIGIVIAAVLWGLALIGGLGGIVGV